jgi:hypothetical protein
VELIGGKVGYDGHDFGEIGVFLPHGECFQDGIDYCGLMSGLVRTGEEVITTAAGQIIFSKRLLSI